MAYLLRPSAASSWVKCAGYPLMVLRHPEVPGDNEVREEGTACHWAAYEVGNGRPVPEGTIAPNGVEIDDHMLDAGQQYLDVLRSWGVPVYMESEVKAVSIHPDECGGTIDAWAWDAARNILYVADLKYGFRFVEVFSNWQLLAYVRGAYDYLRLHNMAPNQPFAVVMTIVQPRSYGADTVRTWRTTSDALQPYMTKLQQRASIAVALQKGWNHVGLDDYAQLTAGDHCGYCPALAYCKAHQQAIGADLDTSTDAISLELSPQAVANRLRQVETAMGRLKDAQNAYTAQLEHQIAVQNIQVPHYEVSSGPAKDVWKEGIEAQVITLGKLLGQDLTKPQKVLTVIQARAKIDPKLIAQYTESRSGKRKLRRLPDNHAAKLFDRN